MTHPKSHRGSVAEENLCCVVGESIFLAGRGRSGINALEQASVVLCPKGSDDFGDDMKAVFRYLQGLSVWEAAALF